LETIFFILLFSIHRGRVLKPKLKNEALAKIYGVATSAGYFTTHRKFKNAKLGLFRYVNINVTLLLNAGTRFHVYRPRIIPDLGEEVCDERALLLIGNPRMSDISTL